MRTIIAGGRDYHMTPDDFRRLDAVRRQIPITEVVCGCARGADTGGEQWARSRGIPVKRFPAQWDKHGRKAGPIRNGEMARYAEALIAFPGGHGTANMVKQATERGLKVFDWRAHSATPSSTDAARLNTDSRERYEA